MSEAKKAANPTKKDAPKAPKLNREMKRFTDAAGGELRFTALEKKGGTGEFYVVHLVRDAEGKKDASKSKGRGASQKFADFAAAKTALESGVEIAAKRGWKPVQKKGGRKDAFDLASLPAPARS